MGTANIGQIDIAPAFLSSGVCPGFCPRRASTIPMAARHRSCTCSRRGSFVVTYISARSVADRARSERIRAPRSAGPRSAVRCAVPSPTYTRPRTLSEDRIRDGFAVYQGSRLSVLARFHSDHHGVEELGCGAIFHDSAGAPRNRRRRVPNIHEKLYHACGFLRRGQNFRQGICSEHAKCEVGGFLGCRDTTSRRLCECVPQSIVRVRNEQPVLQGLNDLPLVLSRPGFRGPSATSTGGTDEGVVYRDRRAASDTAPEFLVFGGVVSECVAHFCA